MQQVLAVAVGVTFLMLTLSLVASGAAEVVASLLRLRANMLERTVVAMLSGVWAKRPGAGATRAVAGADQPLVALLDDPRYASGYPGLRGRGKRPSYLEPATFADLVLHHFVGTAAQPGERSSAAQLSATEVEAGLRALTDTHPELAEVLDRLWAEAAADVGALRAGLGRWFDATMDRISGWYRRRIRWILGIVGAVLAVGLNISVLHVAEALWTDPLQRELVVAQADAAVAAGDPAGGDGTTSDAVSRGLSSYQALTGSGLPLGWKVGATPDGPFAWLAAIAGWLIVALGVSLGAPFWFDVLNRFVNVRLTGRKPGEPSDGALRASEAGTGGRSGASGATVGGVALGTTPIAGGPVGTPGPGAVGSPGAPWDLAALEVPTSAHTAFTAEHDGFAFDNDFVNSYDLPIPGMGPVTTRGRCGGMVFAALDFFHAGLPRPADEQLPADGSPLADLIMARLIDSWARVSALRFLTWSTKGDAQLATLTAAEVEQLLPRLARGTPTPLGLVSARRLGEAGHNHQALATGYELAADGTLTVWVYDNNTHGEDVTLTLVPSRPGIAASNRRQPWRGMFVHSYTQRPVPEDLAADGGARRATPAPDG